jgi:anaerobic dimethyl sulfoxide reductase subunit B (iron-sulfur subunit)
VRGQVGFYIDTTRCINCKTCEIACKDINDLAVGLRIRRVHTFEDGEFPNVSVYNISISCHHCEDPACVRNCPARAYTKRAADGIVIHDPARCIGCRYCSWVCPYGAPQFDPRTGTMKKCNLCIDLTEAGEGPACVGACPMRAIEVGPLSEIGARPGAAIAIRCLPPPEITKPSSRYKVRSEAQKGLNPMPST